MYLHMGACALADYREIIGVFDLDHVSASHRTREFLKRAEEDGKLEVLGDRLPVSLVVTERGAYLSPISAQALNRRLAENSME